jgi:hypothetical protein
MLDVQLRESLSLLFFSNQRESVIDSFPDAKSTIALTSSPQLGEWFCGERVASTCSVTDLGSNHSKQPHSQYTQRWCTSTPWRNGSDKPSCCSKRARPRCVSPQLIACSLDNNADNDFFSTTQARITTKYHIPNLETEKYASKKRKRTAADSEEKTGEDAPRVPRATLEVKAYDPVSGTTLKFKTEKSADVGRLIAGVGRLGRQMAALPEKAEGVNTLSGTL